MWQSQALNAIFMKRPWLIVLVVMAVLALTAGALYALPSRTVPIARVSFAGGTVRAEIVRDEAAQARGLSGRASLAPDGGMLFVFPAVGSYAIWMKEMRFPIDIFWIRGGKVVDMEERVPAPVPGTRDAKLVRYHSDIPADMILETNAGYATAHGVRIGDAVEVLYGTEKFFSAAAGRELAEVSAKMNALPGTSAPLGVAYTIEALRASPAEGSGFVIGREVAAGRGYKKFAISYRSGTLTISGVMNVPTGAVPAGGFPVLILNHGLISPDIYFSGRGSKREQDFFARHGYATLHPDYRGLASSSPNASAHHDFYVGYSEDVSNLVDALKTARLPYIDTNRIGMWGHSLGGGITARVMTLRHDIKAFVLFASISADAEDNFYELTPEEINYLRATYGPAGAEIYKKISPLTYFNDVAAPVQIHHGTADAAVPVGFSEKIYATLRQYGKEAEYYTYAGQQHEFIEDWPLAAERSLQFFDKYVKEAR